MLREIENVTQDKPGRHRRWFASPYFDLIVRYNGQEEIEEFELCYGKGEKEKVLIWKRDRHYAHHNVDDGEHEPFRYKMTPIYVPDGYFQRDAVIDRFGRGRGASTPRWRHSWSAGCRPIH